MTSSSTDRDHRVRSELGESLGGGAEREGVYVELQWNLFSGTAPSLTLQVTAPLDGFTVPPGYYLLFVIEEKTDPLAPTLAPSSGKWLKLVP